MFDPKMELDNLRMRLLIRSENPKVVEEIMANAEREVSEVISDEVQSSLQRAIEAGAEVKSDDFVTELRAMMIGHSFQITTDSGRMDFSEPPFPMLPRLLKNAKTAKDGSRYKVIPIKKKAQPVSKEAEGNKTAMEAMKALDEARRKTAQGAQARKHGERLGSLGILEQASQLSSFYKYNAPREKTEERPVQTPGTTVDFKTVSSKQDPATQWVHPGRKIDMGETLRLINFELEQRISERVMEVIRKYAEFV